MDNLPPTELLGRILGISPAELYIPHRLLQLNPHERDGEVIDRAARHCCDRIRAMQPHVAADVFDWMLQMVSYARGSMMTAAGSMRAAAPQAAVEPPRAASPFVTAASEPSGGSIPSLPRPATIRRASAGDLDRFWSAAVAMLAVVLFLLAGSWFVQKWFIDTVPRPPDNGNSRGGRGDIAQTGGTNRLNVRRGSGSAKVVARHNRRARDSADEIAEEPGRPAADDSAETMRLVAAYQEQYSELADEALRALNGNNEIDLSPRYGRGAFLEQDDDSVTFQINGRPKKLRINELNGIPGVRFRITQNYLSNADNAANELILGAYHYASGLNDRGKPDIDEAYAQALEHWKKADLMGDDEVKEQARMFLKLPRPSPKN